MGHADLHTSTSYFTHVRDKTVHRDKVFLLLLVFFTPQLYAELNCSNDFIEPKMFKYTMYTSNCNHGECFLVKAFWFIDIMYIERQFTKPSPLNIYMA